MELKDAVSIVLVQEVLDWEEEKQHNIFGSAIYVVIRINPKKNNPHSRLRDFFGKARVREMLENRVVIRSSLEDNVIFVQEEFKHRVKDVLVNVNLDYVQERYDGGCRNRRKKVEEELCSPYKNNSKELLARAKRTLLSVPVEPVNTSTTEYADVYKVVNAFGPLTPKTSQHKPSSGGKNPYARTITDLYSNTTVYVDVYKVLNAFGPLTPQRDHAIKKLLCAGTRGGKGIEQDLEEAIESIRNELNERRSK